MHAPPPHKPVAATCLKASRQHVVGLLFATAAALTLLSLAGQSSRLLLGHPSLYGLVPLFHVDTEHAIPVWFQALVLAACAAGAVMVAATERARAVPGRRYWPGIAVLFLYLSADEAAGIHERTIRIVDELFGGFDGAFRSSWVVVGLAAVALVSVWLSGFLRRLEAPERRQALAAGALYVGGAIGMEMAAAAAFDGSDPGHRDLMAYVLFAHVEEALEMCGALVFLDLILRRLQRHGPVALQLT